MFCHMSPVVQGAHRGRPVAAAPCTPGLRPAKSPLRGTFDLSLQASGRAEAASLQNTALSPHPCGLPRPSGNVSAILRPPAPAVSAAPDPVVIWGCRPGQAQPPPGNMLGTEPDILPGGAALAGPTVMVNLLKFNGYVGRVSEAPPGNMLATETTAGRFPLPPGEG